MKDLSNSDLKALLEWLHEAKINTQFSDLETSDYQKLKVKISEVNAEINNRVNQFIK